MYLDDIIPETNVPVIRVYEHRSSLSYSFIDQSETEYTQKPFMYSLPSPDVKPLLSPSLSRNSSLPSIPRNSLLVDTKQAKEQPTLTKVPKAVTDHHTSASLHYSRPAGNTLLSPTTFIQTKNSDQKMSSIPKRPSTFHEGEATKNVDSYLKNNGFTTYTPVSSSSDDGTCVPALTPGTSSDEISEASTRSSGTPLENPSLSSIPQETPARFTFKKLSGKKTKKSPTFFHEFKQRLIPSSKRRKHNVPAPFNHDNREIREKYGDFGKELGTGAGGTVRLIRRANDSKIFAIKQFRRREIFEPQRLYMKKVLAEFCIGSTLHHENIIKTFDVVEENGTYFEIMEFIPYDLFDLVMSQDMLSDEIGCLFKQLLTGVKYLFEMGIAHRDLKLDNCVVNEHGVLKIIDFGCSVVFKYPFSDKILLTRGACGSDPYISPESHLEAKYDPRSADIWSSAVLFVCMCIRRFPFMCANPETEPAYKAFLENPDRVFSRIPEESRRVIAKMLEPDPAKRATIDQVWADEWIQHGESCGEGRVSKGHVHRLPEAMNKSNGVELRIDNVTEANSSGITLIDEVKLVKKEKSSKRGFRARK